MFYPSDERVIRPIVTRFLESIGQDGLIGAYGLGSFETLCINPRRIICDKISWLVKLSYNEDYAALLAKHIRDVYDLTALYGNPEYNRYLHSEEFLNDMYRVTLEDSLNRNSRSHSLNDRNLMYYGLNQEERGPVFQTVPPSSVSGSFSRSHISSSFL